MQGVSEAPAVAPTFEALAVGMVASLTRRFTREDVTEFARLVPDAAPVHMDPDFAREMGYDNVLAHGWLAAAPFSGLLGNQLPGPRTVLHWVRVNMVGPVFAGDEIEYRCEVRQLSATTRAVVLDLQATRAGSGEIVVRGQAQCGFRQ
jgi:acyl dehydratase